MKILYGVQGTGNGHITRARIMAKAFLAAEVEVDYLFSGRNEADYFDMSCFHQCQYYRGLTFQLDNGRIRYAKTVIHNNLVQFYRELQSIDVSGYDVVLTDFEPLTAWACKHTDIPLIGLGHQYVFQHPVPQEKPSFISQKTYDYFAPVKQSLAMHWHHFDSPILPPLVEHNDSEVVHQQGLVVVYLPLENQQAVASMLSPFSDHHFIVYSPQSIESQWSHIEFKPLSRDGFQVDLNRCDAVICNAGFELSSEALYLGKRLLVRPLRGQHEQQSNALALKKLGYGEVMTELKSESVKSFLNEAPRMQIRFPDVASYIVNWLVSGRNVIGLDWYLDCWHQLIVNRSAR